jgi:hypothetical protein
MCGGWRGKGRAWTGKKRRRDGWAWEIWSDDVSLFREKRGTEGGLSVSKEQNSREERRERKKTHRQ